MPLDAWFREAGLEAVRERLAHLPDAIDRTMPLMSANAKHFRPINELDLVVFRP